MVTANRLDAASLVAAVLPTLGVAALCIVLIVGGLFRQWPVLYADPVPGTTEVLMAAILEGNLAVAHAAIQNGADPNRSALVRQRELTGRRGAEFTPLALAVTLGAEQMVTMLLGSGAETRGDAGATAWCAAERRGEEHLVPLLREYGATPPDAGCHTATH